MKKVFYFIVLMAIMTSCIFNAQDRTPTIITVKGHSEIDLIYATMLSLMKMETEESLLMADMLGIIVVNDYMSTEKELQEVMSSFTTMLIDEQIMNSLKEVEESHVCDSITIISQ